MSEYECALGLDIGGTKIAAGIVTRDGQIVLHKTIATRPQRGGEAVADDAYQLAHWLCNSAAESGYRPTAVGISICELVNRNGEIVSDQTIKWRELPVSQRFSHLAPTTIEADSRAAAFCEARYGAGRRWSNFLYVTIGTGISCSLMIEGTPYMGTTGATGTMATGPITLLCSSCGRWTSSVVEQISSGPALALHYGELSGLNIGGAEDVLAAAQLGDAKARDVIMAATTSVGSIIGLLVSVLDPQAVVVGGGLGSAPGLYWETLQAATRSHIWSEVQRQLPIVQGTYGNTAALVGAAALALTGRA
jgi:glucokinase